MKNLDGSLPRHFNGLPPRQFLRKAAVDGLAAGITAGITMVLIGLALTATLLLVAGAVFLASKLSITPAAAQHRHPPEHAQLHKDFYRTWKMPDDPARSCCSDADCYPTEVRYEHERWYMRRREDGAWLLIPPAKIERNRDAPDARAHLCAPPPYTQGGQRGEVFCASLGSGS